MIVLTIIFLGLTFPIVRRERVLTTHEAAVAQLRTILTADVTYYGFTSMTYGSIDELIRASDKRQGITSSL